jgi:hypothetical protein
VASGVAASALLAVTGLVLLPPSAGVMVSASHTRLVPASWPDADLEAATWIAAHGPQGRYGSPDAGAIGFYLDGIRPVVNLDGLVNSYTYANALQRGDTAINRYRTLGLDYLVARRASRDPDVPPCAAVIWTSSAAIAYFQGGDFTGHRIVSLPVRIWDLRGCRV